MLSEILITRDGQQFGPYSLEQLQQHVADGTITQDDLAWIGGDQTEWQPLRELVDIEVTPESSSSAPPPPPPAPQRSPEKSKSKGLPLWNSDLPMWRKVLAMTFIILFGVGVIAMLVSEGPDAKEDFQRSVENSFKESLRPKTIKAKGPAIEVAIAAMVHAYRENPIAADGVYKGRLVKTSGLVSGIERNSVTDAPYLEVTGHIRGIGDYKLGEIRLDFERDNEVGKLRTGQFIVFQGACQGADMFKKLRFADIKILKTFDPHTDAREGIEKFLKTLE